MKQWNCWSLRCSWSITYRRCSNYIFILNLTPGFNGLGKSNYKMRRETCKFWDLMWHILEVWWYIVLLIIFLLDDHVGSFIISPYSYRALYLEGALGRFASFFHWVTPSHLGKGQQVPLENLNICIETYINLPLTKLHPDSAEGGSWGPPFPNPRCSTSYTLSNPSICYDMIVCNQWLVSLSHQFPDLQYKITLLCWIYFR